MPRTLEVLFFLRQIIPAERRKRTHIALYNKGICRYVSSNMPAINRRVMYMRGLVCNNLIVFIYKNNLAFEIGDLVTGD